MKKLLLTIALLAGLFAPVVSVETAHAAATFGDKNDTKCSAHFLTFPTWYRGLPRGAECAVESPSNSDGLTTFIFTIVLNIIEIGLQLVAYAAVGFVIYGGFKYLTSAGDPSRVTAGRKIITNALVGLLISFLSIAIVNLIANNLK